MQNVLDFGDAAGGPTMRVASADPAVVRAQVAKVSRAAAARANADNVLRAAIQDAYAAGVPYAELARELGVTRQAVRQFANPAPRVSRPPAAPLEAAV